MKRLLEENYYPVIDAIFSVFSDPVTRCKDNPALKIIHTLCSGIACEQLYNHFNYDKYNLKRISCVIKFDSSKVWQKILLIAGNKRIYSYSFLLKFHFLDHRVGDGSRFIDLKFLDASPFKGFYYVIKTFITLTSLRRGNTLEEAVRLMDMSIGGEEKRKTITV